MSSDVITPQLTLEFCRCPDLLHISVCPVGTSIGIEGRRPVADVQSAYWSSFGEDFGYSVGTGTSIRSARSSRMSKIQGNVSGDLASRYV